MADALIKYETIDEEQLKDIMAGNAPKPPKDWDETLSNKPPQAPPAPRRRSADSRGTALTVHAARGSGARLTGVRRTMSPQAPPVRLRCADKTLDLSTPLVMGVLNVTPDSFSDGGRFLPAEAAVAHGAAHGGGGRGHHRCRRRVDAPGRERGERRRRSSRASCR